ncbi:Arm DNA-binding domain-containing protein [Dysgonomonas termitidis]|uniref:Arm DNA-binding domain-containing protein n=1 Tax=Dysgonomonas termitidis TaxID=1516126 RepID=A0ABV9L0Y6_9BACT
MNAIQTTFSLLYVIRKHRLLKNGEASIYLRITVNGDGKSSERCPLVPNLN